MTENKLYPQCPSAQAYTSSFLSMFKQIKREIWLYFAREDRLSTSARRREAEQKVEFLSHLPVFCVCACVAVCVRCPCPSFSFLLLTLFYPSVCFVSSFLYPSRTNPLVSCGGRRFLYSFAPLVRCEELSVRFSSHTLRCPNCDRTVVLAPLSFQRCWSVWRLLCTKTNPFYSFTREGQEAVLVRHITT